MGIDATCEKASLQADAWIHPTKQMRSIPLAVPRCCRPCWVQWASPDRRPFSVGWHRRRGCTTVLSGPVTGIWWRPESLSAVSHPGTVGNVHVVLLSVVISKCWHHILNNTYAGLSPLKDEFVTQLKSRGLLSLTSIGLSFHLMPPWKEE